MLVASSLLWASNDWDLSAIQDSGDLNDCTCLWPQNRRQHRVFLIFFISVLLRMHAYTPQYASSRCARFPPWLADRNYITKVHKVLPNSTRNQITLPENGVLHSDITSSRHFLYSGTCVTHLAQASFHRNICSSDHQAPVVQQISSGIL
jgi:hypothetical protein